MELSKGSITGITIAIITCLIASFGLFIFLRRRRRRRQRRTASATAMTSTSATTSSTTPSSHKNNAHESHVLQPRKKKFPSGLKKQNHHRQDQASDTQSNLNLGNGFGATATTTTTATPATVDTTIANMTPPSESQGLTTDKKTAFPNLEVPSTTTAAAAAAEPTSPYNITARDNGAYATDNMTARTIPACLTANFSVDHLEQQRHFAFSDRPSSLRQAVLEVGGREEEMEDVGRASRDDDHKTEDSDQNVARDVSTRPTGYTGAWP